MWSPALMLLACLSLFVSMVACLDFCPAKTIEPTRKLYELTLENSINKLIDVLRKGDPGLHLRLENLAVLGRTKDIKLERHENHVDMELNNGDAIGFIDLSVTGVHVETHGLSSDITVSLKLEIPSIVFEADCRFNGTWKKKYYGETGMVNLTVASVVSMISLDLTLDSERKHWNMTEFRMERQHVTYINRGIHFESSVLEESGLGNDEEFRSELTGRIEKVLLNHLRPLVRGFLYTFLGKIRWFAVIFGKFDPYDHELYSFYS